MAMVVLVVVVLVVVRSGGGSSSVSTLGGCSNSGCFNADSS